MAKPYPNGSGSVAAVAEHPLHPMVVPIPIRAFILAFVSDLFFVSTGSAHWLSTSYFLLAAGLVGSVVAAALGIMDTMGLQRARSMGLVWAHASLNIAAVALVVITVMLRTGTSGDAENPSLSTFNVVLTGAVAGLVLLSGWLGGEVSYKHGVGVAESVGVDRPDGNPDLDPFGRPDIGKG